MSDEKALISLPADELLVRFGDEKPTPGSGCAAALMGLLSASLICAVSKLTAVKSDDQGDRDRAKVIIDVVEGRIAPELREAFQRDADLFSKLIEQRRERDLLPKGPERTQVQRAVNAALEPATDILFDMMERCFELIDYGIALYGIGYKAARGDTGAALSAAVAAISSTIFVIALNVKTSKAKWAQSAMERLDQSQKRLAGQQKQIFSLITQSKDEAFLAIQGNFAAVTGDE
jgi:formiminotetrahydrofolate cyclodeaminase